MVSRRGATPEPIEDSHCRGFMRRSAEEEEGNSGSWWAGEPTRASWRMTVD